MDRSAHGWSSESGRSAKETAWNASKPQQALWRRTIHISDRSVNSWSSESGSIRNSLNAKVVRELIYSRLAVFVASLGYWVPRYKLPVDLRSTAAAAERIHHLQLLIEVDFSSQQYYTVVIDTWYLIRTGYVTTTPRDYKYMCMCVFFTLERSFYPSTSSTTSVRADSPILLIEEIPGTSATTQPSSYSVPGTWVQVLGSYSSSSINITKTKQRSNNPIN